MIHRWLIPLALLVPSPALADTLIDNINGISVDRDGVVTRFGAMIIGDDGRISRILPRSDRSVRADFREDGRGRTVIPGFIDSHVDVMELGLSRLVLDLSEVRSLQEAQQRLVTYAAANPERLWFVGRGWDEDTWGLGRLPTTADLDAVVSDRPVWLLRQDGGAGWANSAALAAAGVTATTADPAGGKIVRSTGGRQPSGVLVGAAMDLVAGKVPAPRATEMDLALHEAQDLLVSNGVTAVADMGTSIESWMAYRRAGDQDRLRIRIMAYAGSVPETLLIGGPGPGPWLYQDRLRMNGVSLVLDGPLGSRSALLKAPYADEGGSQGLSLLTGTQLRNLMSRAAMDGFQVAIGAHGDAAIAEALSSIEELANDYRGDRRWRIEHAQVVDPADLRRFSQNGIIASVQPPATGTLQGRLGTERASSADAWRSLPDVGGRLILGSGAPSAKPDPLEDLANVASAAAPALSLEQALASHTAGAAYAGFADGRFGELKAGQHADFIVLDADPLGVDSTSFRNIRVLQTWIGGQKVYDVAPRNQRAADAPGR